MSERSRHGCPVCSQPLSVDRTMDREDRVVLWCGNGFCPSPHAGDGAWGASEDEAYARLEGDIGKETYERSDDDE